MSNNQSTKKEKASERKGGKHPEVIIETDLDFEELVKTVLIPDPNVLVPPPKKRKKKTGK